MFVSHPCLPCPLGFQGFSSVGGYGPPVCEEGGAAML